MELAGKRVLVNGAGLTGRSIVEALSTVDAQITVTDGSATALAELASFGVELAPELTELPAGTELVVTTPSWRPTSPLLVAAQEAGIEVICDVELAWRMGQQLPNPPVWIGVTGTNGKTTTVGMLESILRAAGIDAKACGNIGYPVLDAVRAGHQVLVVELSSYQLHWSNSLAFRASVVLNIAEDHLDWHGTMAEYAAAKGKVHQRSEVVVCNLDDEWSSKLAKEAIAGLESSESQAETQKKKQTLVGFSLRTPRPGELGLVEELLIDRAFTANPASHAEELATIHDVRPLTPYNIANALAAMSLARAYGVPIEAVAKGLRQYEPVAHRSVELEEIAGVRYINDSKATNPHAAESSVRSHHNVVWIAGGLLKGASVEELIPAIAGRLRAVVLIGTDAPVIADALARHAPDVPVQHLLSGDDEPMTAVVRTASALARAGDVVLLAPATASFDMFRNYSHRGDAFADAVHALAAKELPHDGG